jgi:hypothetical protein
VSGQQHDADLPAQIQRLRRALVAAQVGERCPEAQVDGQTGMTKSSPGSP